MNIILVVHPKKSGTSTLQTILNRHPNVIKPTKKRAFEPHFFDWEMGMRNGKQYDNATDDVLCKYRQSYSEYYDLTKLTQNVSVVFEKTPSYMLWPDIPAAVEAVAGPWKPKILAILRNPIDRAWSQYGMDHGKKNNAKPFAEFVNNELVLFRQCGILESITHTFQEYEKSGGGINPFRFRENVTLQEYARMLREYSGYRLSALLYRGLYALLLHPWVEQFAFPDDRLLVLQFEPFMEAENENNRTLVNEVLGFAGVPKYANIQQQIDENINQTRSRIRKYRKMRQRRRKLVRTNAGKGKKTMPPRMRQYLQMFYQPFNDLLADLLGEEWRDVWK